MAPGPRMRTTLTRAGGAAAPVAAPYVSAASPRRAVPRVSAGASAAWLRPAGVWGEEGAASAPVSGVWAWPVLPWPSAPYPGRLGAEVGAPPGGFPRPHPA
ncbi:hypothetical protein NN561_005514 [Cricetulus griseus]